MDLFKMAAGILMKKGGAILKRYLLSHFFVLTALLLSTILFSSNIFLGIDAIQLLNKASAFFHKLDRSHVDDLLLATTLLVVGGVLDAFIEFRRKQRKRREDARRLQTFHATMRTVHDLVNNFVNGAQLIRMEAEDHGVSQETLQEFDELTRSTTANLKAFSEATHLLEIEMATGAGIRLPEEDSNQRNDS